MSQILAGGNSEPPLVSIVVLLRGRVHALSKTLESIFHQTKTSYEVILIQNASTPYSRQLYSYDPKKIRMYREEDSNLSHLLNKGISYAKGKYIHFLHPGDSYLSWHSLEHVEKELLQGSPDLLYSGYLLRDGKKPPEAVINPLDKNILVKGRLPTRLSSFLFSKNVFERIGFFDPAYSYRPGFDLICRIFLHKDLKTTLMRRVLVDYEVQSFPMGKYRWETFGLIQKHFGLSTAFSWCFIQGRRKVLSLLRK